MSYFWNIKELSFTATITLNNKEQIMKTYSPLFSLFIFCNKMLQFKPVAPQKAKTLAKTYNSNQSKKVSKPIQQVALDWYDEYAHSG